MKSTVEQLQHRGYISDADYEKNFRFYSIDYRANLSSNDPCIRTATIRKINQNREYEYIPDLCNLLKKEKALYTRIEICNCLSSFGNKSTDYLLPLIGKIGHNQHQKIGNYDIRKKSYPLPRDIVSRILVRIGPGIFNSLKITLDTTEDVAVISEIVDIIGHITFNYKDFRFEDTLITIYENTHNEFIRWKIIRAFQSFTSEKVTTILEEEYNDPKNKVEIRIEAERSLQRITDRK